ncbi:exo-alpha-sialidase [Vibrio kyushuensis]|uniref:exo-alpha-sialidase n=1 Tax=Vibrio kyushuensis TaxID=2910249 RepID=UPI003D0C7BC6
MNVKVTHISLILASALFVAPAVNAKLINYLATNDSAQDEPMEQGWLADHSGSGNGATDTADGFPTWIAKGENGRAQWKVVPIASEHAQASDYGWRLTTDMKVISGGMITNYYANGTNRVLPIISLNGNGELVVAFEGQSGSTVLATGESATDYHRYELIYHPGSTPTASFYFDGQLAVDQISPVSTTQNMMVWGNGSSHTNGVAAYREIQFEIQGDMIFAGPDRIPSIVTSSLTPGVVTAFSEKRVGGGDPGSINNTNDIITRVSHDGGVSWGNEINLTKQINASDSYDFSDPRPIYDKNTDRVLVSYVRWPTDAAQNGDKIKSWMPSGVFYNTYDVSTDNWQAPIDVTDQLKERSFQIAGWGGSEIYQRNANLNSQQDWRATAKVKVFDGAENRLQIANGIQSFELTLAIDSLGQLTASLNGEATPIVLKPAGDRVTAFYEYQFEYSASSGAVSLSVDNVQIASWQGQVSTDNLVGFGNADSAVDGRIHLQSISLTQQGASLVALDAYHLAQQNPADTVTDLQQLGWTKIKSGNTMSFYGHASVNPGPGHGIQLENQQSIMGTNNGRMIYPAITLDRYFLNVLSVYSDDGGLNWQSGSSLPLPYRWKSGTSMETLEPSEADLVELNNGHLLLTARLDFNKVVDGVNYGPRQQFLSTDSGESWQLMEGNNATVFSGMSTGTVDASITRFEEADGSRYLLFTNPQGSPSGTNGRQELGLWFSFDEGLSWKGPIQLVEGASAYSDIYQLDSTSAIVIVETNSSNMRILRVPITLLKQKAMAL